MAISERARHRRGADALLPEGIRPPHDVGASMRDVHAQPALQRLLHAEPEAALRILTSTHGRVGLIDVAVSVPAEQEALGALSPGIHRETLSSVIADDDPQVGLAVEVVGRLLT